MKFSATVVLAAAIGASAHPSNHGHRHAHRSVQAREFVMAKKPVPPPPSTTTPPPPASSSTSPSPAPAPPSSSAAPSSSSASPSPSAGSGSRIPFCQGQKRATLAQIAYAGNTGGTGSSFGCNVMEIPSNIASLYDYTVKFVNQGDKTQQCKVWNKMGPAGLINGFFAGNEILTFNLAPHGEQYIAVDSNSQIGASCYAGSVPLTTFGQFAATWFEGDFASTPNNQNSGFDASCLVPAKYGLDIPGMQVCGGNVCSTIFAGGKGENAYVGGMEDVDGTGGNIPRGPLHVTVTVDYSP
ncbi:hypothetical protein NQ176_g5776 [Zarea fungicola]|uniref:Uncharacterized protein n=1 Tax=Zarea fungicola TaxID=93591 RepID=A0ACC1N8N1_9HYPO|nr:hypothetical protein NQ176_g5776 [Lecanicillium fungicola]